MKSLRRKFEGFCFRNRSKGIPNLMLYLSVGSAIVYLFSMATQNYVLYAALAFDRGLILQGQVWRLFSYAITFNAGNILFEAIGLFCYFSLGRAMEHSWGTFRFNLFYFSGILMMDIYSMIFGCRADVTYLNLSLFLGFATLYPESRFLLFFIIPVKAWIFALVDLGLVVFSLVVDPFPYNLFAVVSLANYFLFFGKDVLNVFPLSWRINAAHLFKKKPKKTGTIPFAGSYAAEKATPRAPYTHKCTVCGRTDVSDPDLEFRYCSRCSGYHCYCQDHINNHAHIE